MKAGMILLALCLGLAGCNTMAGLGQDMQRAGSNLQERAADSQAGVAPDRATQNSYNAPGSYAPPPGAVEPDTSGYPPPPPPRPYSGGY
jgi:predicted small secreted protein